jgi:hypothetical protein
MNGGRQILAELTEEQFSFLEDFEKRCNGSGNTSISKGSILRCLLRLFEEVDVDVRGVETEDELFYRALDILKAAHV